MDSTNDVIMGDPAVWQHPDLAVNARLQSFVEGGHMRRSLAEWLDDRSRASRHNWRMIIVSSAREFLKGGTITGPLSEDQRGFLTGVWPQGVRECLASHGMEPGMLKTLFGNPDEYDVRTCSFESLAYLLCHGSDVDLLIGSGIPSMH